LHHAGATCADASLSFLRPRTGQSCAPVTLAAPTTSRRARCARPSRWRLWRRPRRARGARCVDGGACDTTGRGEKRSHAWLWSSWGHTWFYEVQAPSSRLLGRNAGFLMLRSQQRLSATAAVPTTKTAMGHRWVGGTRLGGEGRSSKLQLLQRAMHGYGVSELTDLPHLPHLPSLPSPFDERYSL
jgi:hypothetical protein